jgi:phage terminase large subunit-like protein
MGLRGPGAARAKQAREAVAAEPMERVWDREGLTRAERVIAFVESLPITKGKLAGEKLRLLPGQRDFIQAIYGGPRIRIAVKSEPRGNGKTGLLAPLALCHLVGPEAEPRGEVYAAAIDRQQAGIMFNEMEAIILAVPEFAVAVNVQRFHKRLEVLVGQGAGSVFEALSSDARRGHGLAPSLWVYDELAQAKDRELLDNLITAMGKRKQALGVIISTQAPSDEHPLSQIIDDGLSGADPSILVHLKSAPVDADPFDVETIRAVNPALGVFLDEGDLVAEAERARRLPAFEPAFRNLRLNQRVEAGNEARLCTAPVWKLGAVPVDAERLEGRACVAALDLSGKHDLTSLTLAFPDDEPEPSYDILQFFWTPLGAMEARRPAEQELFRRWISEGHIEGIPGPVIRTRRIAEKLLALKRRYRITAVGYDRWRIDDLKQDLADLGEPDDGEWLQPFGQGFKDMAPAIEFFAECALTARIRHGGNPVLTACVANAILTSDPAGNQKIDKGRSHARGTTRIDGAVTLAMALGLARRGAPEEGPSVYESRGILML